jgi:predicted acylesterase/phospholipase RssA
MAGLPGCSLPTREAAVPSGSHGKATVLGLPNERFYPASGSAPLEQEFITTLSRNVMRGGRPIDGPMTKIDMLAVSGGGENGAFGAGLLCGWSAQGTRPEFEVVTGISTGALTAPFAYLGSSYDPQLKAVYTELEPKQVLLPRFVTAALVDDAMADNSPLFATISKYLDERMMADIARAYDAGRLLLIASTDLDAQQPVIWNVGAIAKSGHPKALDTVRRILLASAAIPGAFPPTMFDVTVDGKQHQEMHVDGGAFAQTFLYPSAMTQQRQERIRKGQKVLPAEAYIIRNGRFDPEWASVERRTMGIAGRAISTMITSAGYNDVVRIYATSVRDHVGYNLAYIGSDFNMTLSTPFEPSYMRALFDYGYQRAVKGYDWAKRPPMF